MVPLPPLLAARADRALHTPMARSTGRAASELLGLLMPSSCTVCGLRDGTVCPDCRPGLSAELLHPFRAERDAAALPLVTGTHDAGPSPGLDLVPLPVVAAARYGGAVSRALLAFKDHGRTPVGRYLRPAVHRALAAAPDLLPAAAGSDSHPAAGSLSPPAAGSLSPPAAGRPAGPFALVPVPGSASGFRRRGYDPVAELLAGPLPAGWELHQRILRGSRGPSRRSHAGAASRQRRHRSAGRFLASGRHRDLKGRTVVLFDDVMTTGSTLAAAWRALAAAGLRPAGAVVLAAVTAPGTAAAEGLNSA